jgi:D-sedoheptulose 7-phosphate isomerase
MASREAGRVEALATRVAEAFRQGQRVLACGNGGSAADAQHVAGELAGRFYLDRDPLDAIALMTNPSLVTAVANDYGYDEVFARQIEGFGRSGDVLLLFTTSGRSPNMLRAVEVGKRRGLLTVGFTGAHGREFAESCDVAFVVPSEDTPRIQEAHIALGHALCECVEVLLFGAREVSPPRERAR